MKWIYKKTKQGYQWILNNLTKTLITLGIITVVFAVGAPADQATFNVHKNQIATTMTEQVTNASSTLPFSRENATFRKYNKETSGFLTIGKKGSDIFVPEFTIVNWKETSFKLIIPTNVKAEDHILSFPTVAKMVKGKMATTSKLKWSDGVNDAVFYELDNGDFEFEYILYAKPPTNTITFDIETENLDFFYQPRLDAQAVAEEKSFNDGVVSDWGDVEWIANYYNKNDRKDGYTATSSPDVFRPENIVDSYAVYHSTQSGDQSGIGGKDYKTGKAGHWKRSKIFSNVGDYWAEDFIIDKVAGKMSIIIPTEIYDDVATDWASGVILDPTFGFTGVGASNSTLGDTSVNEWIQSGQFAPSSSGAITDISVHIPAGSPTSVAVAFAIYDDAFNFIEKTGLLTGWTTGIFNIASLLSTPDIVSETNYRLAAWGDAGGTVTRKISFDSSGGTGKNQNLGGNFPIWPDPWSTGNTNSRKYSIYATYTLPAPTIADFSHFQTITICGDGGGAGCVATTTTNGYAILATTTQATLAATSSSGRIEKTVYDSANNIEKPLDLIFTNSADELLDYEIESYSTTTGQLVAWIEVDDISSTTPKTFKIFYGNASATGNEDALRVWNSTYAGVWHLPEDPSGTAPQMLDSTGNNNDGTSNGTMLSTDQSNASSTFSGQIDGALSFDGGDDNVSFSPFPVLNQDDLSICVWAKIQSSVTGNLVFIEGGARSPGALGYNFYSASNDRLTFNISDSVSRITPVSVVEDIRDGTWHFVCVTAKRSSIATFYIDGVAKGTSDISSKDGIDIVNPTLSIQTWLRNPVLIDEVRVLTLALHSMDILTDYNMSVDNTTFLSFGSEQATGVALPTGGTPNFFIKGMMFLKGKMFKK